MSDPLLAFHGAARAVTGSCFRVTTGTGSVLVDCGMFQGSKTEKALNWRAFPFDPAGISAVLLTHAHIDHSGLLPKLWRDGSLPQGFHFTLLDNDFDHFTPLMELALGRVPAMETAGVKQMINGPESFTPDGMFILGEAPEQRNFFVGAGFNGMGIASGGGAGMCLAEWVAKGETPFDLWPADIRRFGRPHFDTDWIRKRTYEAYGKHYTMAWPSEEHHSGRPCRKSPLYETLKSDGAVFGEKLGWERPNWYARDGVKPEYEYSYGRQH